MRHRLCLAALALLLLTALAIAQEKKDLDKEKKEVKKEELVKLGEVTGTITQLGEDKSITVKVTARYLEPNTAALQNQANLARRQIEILRNPNPVERQRQLVQLQIDIANNQRNLYTPKEVSKDVQFQAADSLKIRCKEPPLAFDDKGNPRKRTKKELDELKGEGNLPGYQSDWDQLRTGQLVAVTVAQKKEAAARGQPKKDLDRDLERKLLDADKPYATMIVILSEPVQK
jgi:predicted secreted protein